jgi:hypothetical protein
MEANNNKGWIEANEQEIVKWDIDKQHRLIRFGCSLVGQNDDDEDVGQNDDDDDV